VHALGGHAMMQGAAQALAKSAERMRVPRPRLLAVTILTSHDARSVRADIGLRGRPEQEVKRLALLAQAAGCDGVVCSPQEISIVRKACGPDFLIVTPGVRQAGASKQDQKRTMTAGQAIAAGADYLVVGRPITGAADPVEAVQALAEDMRAAADKAAKRAARPARKKAAKKPAAKKKSKPKAKRA